MPTKLAPDIVKNLRQIVEILNTGGYRRDVGSLIDAILYEPRQSTHEDSRTHRPRTGSGTVSGLCLLRNDPVATNYGKLILRAFVALGVNRPTAKTDWSQEITWLRTAVNYFGAKTAKNRTHRQTSPRVLTPRQLEATQAFGECQGNYTVTAKRLGRSVPTIRQHVKQAYKKLGQRVPVAKTTKPLPTTCRGGVSLSQDDDRRLD